MDGNRLSTNFYNAKTGYKGPWAHAVMRGFYFTPPPTSCYSSSSSTSASNNVSADTEDDRDTYQELELFYVGDGLGAMLEENEIVDNGKIKNYGEGDDEDEDFDEWGNLKIVEINEMEKVKKDLKRRQMYARPKASASFTVM